MIREKGDLPVTECMAALWANLAMGRSSGHFWVGLHRRCRGMSRVLGCSVRFLHWFVDDRLRRELCHIVGVL